MTSDPRQHRLLSRWGAFVARRARAVVLVWVLAIVAGFAVSLGLLGGPSLFDRLDSGEILTPGDNQDGRELLDRGGSTGFSTYTLTIEDAPLADPAVVAAAQQAVSDLSQIEHVESAVNPFVMPDGPTSPQALAMLGKGGLASGAFATTVTYDRSITAEQEQAAQEQVDVVFDRLVEDSGAQASQRGGIRDLVDAIVGQVKADGQRGEGVALPLSFVVMIVVFGGFLAAGMPIVGAIASISGALVSLLAFSYVLELDATVVNVVTVLGLGLCIDYGLLVVSRFREELRAELAHPVPATEPMITRSGRRRGEVTPTQIAVATERTVNRAGRTVIFSGLTVAIALGGLIVIPVEFIRAVAAAGVSVVLVALAVALSLIPALCVLGARRILGRGTETAGDTGVFSRLAAFVHRRPWPIIALVLAVLMLMAAPILSIRLSSSGPELLPKGTPERTYFENLAEVFPRLGGPEVALVSTAPPAQLQEYAASAGELPGVLSVDPVQVLDNDIVVLGLRTGDGGQGDPSRDLVAHLHEHPPPFEAKIVGQASGIWDFRQVIVDHGPTALLLVALATFALLFLMTGSIVIPLKALVMNLVSLGACLGAVVWIFQDAHLESLLHFDSVGGIESTIPLLVLAFGFGLSMDYEVFLLSRIVELHEAGHDTDSAVGLGLQRSGRIISSAALLMIIVFSGFAAGELLIMKEMGVGMVIAVFIDATLVRMLLVPATMTVLGSANWWAPAPLKRLHARWGITE
ncbi:MAG: MMPL family transporter [Phycicoccus sp.]|nr:MMPL family transporter [Phycicoccus sp.]